LRGHKFTYLLTYILRNSIWLQSAVLGSLMGKVMGHSRRPICSGGSFYFQGRYGQTIIDNYTCTYIHV